MVVAFEGISAFHLAVPGVVFAEAQDSADRFQIQVCSAEAPQLNTSSGYQITVEAGLSALRQAELIIIPSWRDPNEAPPAKLLQALVDAHRRGARLVGLCLGAYVLAAAGLLNGRQATTHWAYIDDFRRRFPAVKLQPDVLYLADDDVVTSAGTAAGIDCCLQLLRQQCGAESANRVARRLVVQPHRQGGQAQFIEQPLPQAPRRSRLSELLDWVRRHLDQPHSLDSLAQRAHMSRRSFTRHFRQLTGSSVHAWLLNERLQYCQRLLESSDLAIEQIADQAGFGSTVAMRQRFKQRVGVSPQQWRQSFRGTRTDWAGELSP
ncbi:GlxA family transcriptional regulator [Motiliproteus sp.]|uniref:GlxA family transcriptional regulator n=1 Tax=Motiliproteus sp. TaxID=1898955 RepID=UPI003BAA0CB9